MKRLIVISVLITLVFRLNGQTCFTPNWTGNGLDHMNFYITQATVNGIDLQPGDQIGIFDGDECVGAGVLTSVLTEASLLSIVTSKDDPGTLAKDGFTVDSLYSFRLCLYSGDIIVTNGQVSYTGGTGVFSIGGTATVKLSGTVDSPIAPFVSDIPDQTIAEGATFVTISLDDYVSDLDNTDAEMTWSYSGNTALTVAIDINRVATITIPNADWNGAETITFTATDPGSLSDNDQAIFTVTSVNDAPGLASIGNKTICQESALTFTASASDIDIPPNVLTFSLVNAPSGAAINATTGQFTWTPNVTQAGPYTFLVKVTDNGTPALSDEEEITVTVNTVPAITGTTPASRCGPGTVTLAAISSGGTINWYNVSTGGISLRVGTAFTTPIITVTTTYYVDATDNGCTTESRTQVVATINDIPSITSVTPASHCGSGTVTLGATASAGIINWYDVSTGGTSLGTGTTFTTTDISVTTTYYVDATENECTTASRTPVVATINDIPSITSVTPASHCGSGTVTLGATASAGIINWYDVSTGGTSLGTGTTFTTTDISVTTTYYVDATENECTTTTRTAITATINAIPGAPLTSVDCSLGFNHAVVIVTYPVGTDYEYSINGGTTYQSDPEFTEVVNGSYTITVRNTSSGCIATGSSFDVSCGCVNGPTVTLSSTSGSTCGITPITVSGNTFGGNATSVTITENGSGTVDPGTINTTPFAFTYTPAEGDIGNTVTITVTTDNPLGSPCVEAAATYTLNVISIPATPVVTVTDNCDGTSTLSTTAAGTLLWSTGESTSTITVTTAGTYTVTTTADGCISLPGSGTASPKSTPAAPEVTVTDNCDGTSTLSTTAAGTLLWSTGESTSTITVTTAGTYTVTTTADGCISLPGSGTASPKSIPAIPIESVDCTLGFNHALVTVTYPVGTDYEYSINGGTTYQSDPEFTEVVNGSYTITVRNTSSGCIATGSSFDVSCGCVNGPTITLSSTSGSICGTTPITLSGNTFGGSATSVTITENGSGTVDPGTINTTPFAFIYTPAEGDIGNTVTITVTTDNPLGAPCAEAAATYTLTVYAIPAITGTTPGSRCGGGIVVLGAVASEGTINWYNVSTGGTSLGTGASYTTPVLSSTTTYYVDATENGCTTASRTAVVATVKTIPTIIGVIPASHCGTGAVTLAATASAGTINWYNVSTGGISLRVGTAFTTPIISVTTTYYVDATDNGCTTESRTPVVATINDIPSITSVTPASQCGSGTVTLGATASAGVLNWYSSSTGGTSLFTGASYTTPVLNTTTTYYVDATDKGCTTASRTAVVATINPLPEAITGTTNVCVGSTTTLISSPTGGTWSSEAPSVATIDASTGVVTGVTSGTSVITYTLLTGCSVSTTVTVNALPETPAITASGPTTFCEGGNVTLTASEGSSYYWSTGETTSSINVTTSGSYTVQVTDANGCQSASSEATVVTVNPLPVTPTITASGPTTFCEGGNVTLTSSEGSTYIWSTGATTSGINVTTSGSYTVQVTDANGCQSASSEATVVTVNPLPGAITGKNYVSVGSTTTLSNTVAGGTWSSGTTAVAEIDPSTGIVTGVSSGTSIITYTLGTGCSVSTIFNVLPSGWEVNPPAFTYNGQITAKVFIDEIPVESGFLAAFAGVECRGIVEASYFVPSDHYVFGLMCYSNSSSGETMTFRYYDPASNISINLAKTVDFVPDMIVGSAVAPVKMQNGIDFNKSLAIGWSWFSLNATTDNMTLKYLLSNNVAVNDYIKDQVYSATYYSGYGWFGNLAEIDPDKLYKIKLQNGCNINFCGIPVDNDVTQIALVSGWNWIGYFPQSSIPIDNALSSLTLANLDYIKNQTQSATYYTGSGWFGSLMSLSPGEGYMIKVANPGTLQYPDAPGKKGLSTDADIDKSLYDPASFEFNGSVTAKVLADGVEAGSESDILYAYVNGQVRGVVMGMYFNPKDVFLYPLMIHSNLSDGEIIEFRYYDSETGKLYPCMETVTFRKDMIVADALNPLELNLSLKSTSEANQDLELHTYPNPFEQVLNIEYDLPLQSHVRLTIYDQYGKIIKKLVDKEQQPGHYSAQWIPDLQLSGMYIIKLQVGSRQLVKKVTYIK